MDRVNQKLAARWNCKKKKKKLYRIAQVLICPCCLYRLTRGQSGTLCRSACQWERRLFTALQQAEPQTAMSPSKDKVQLCTGLQQQEHNQQIEGNGSSPVFSTGEPKSGYCIQLWVPQDTALAKGSEAVSLALPAKMVWSQCTWHERRELGWLSLGQRQRWGIAASST